MANRHPGPLLMPCPDFGSPLHTSISPHFPLPFVHEPTMILTFNTSLVPFNAGYVHKMVLYEGEQQRRVFTVALKRAQHVGAKLH